jgi:hypothetical protein
LNIYDKNGIPIHIGDVLKIYHFTAALRRKKYYMYKWVIDKIKTNAGFERFILSHLNKPNLNYKNGYCLQADNMVHKEIEIVQGWGPKEHESFEDRKRGC